MILKHKTNPGFMFNTSKGLRKFNKGKLHLEEDLIETIKKTEDFKNGLIEIEVEVETEVEEEKSKKKSKKRKK